MHWKPALIRPTSSVLHKNIKSPHLSSLSLINKRPLSTICAKMAADQSTDDLDQLLDSALDDFSALNMSTKSNETSGNRESTSSSTPSGLGLGLPELGSKKKKKSNNIKKKDHASEALEELRKQTKEAVKGLESVNSRGGGGAGIENEMEDFVKQFEEMAGSEDMESIVETMMQQLLSKEILHEPMKEIGERYPKWLDEHKAGLSPEEFDRYSRQYELILQLNDVYEHDSNNFQKIIDLMQRMQECGQPPNDIVKELAPDLDMANLAGQLSPEMLASGPNNCSIM